MDENQLINLIMGEYNDTPGKQFVSSASAKINKLTGKRSSDLLSRFSTTGLGRSGIGGAALSDIYSTAGESLADVGAKGAQLDSESRRDAINKLLGLYQFQKQYELEKPGFGDILGGIGGLFAGSTLGKFGSKLGSKLGSLLD